ncbi:hypothetical protein OH77DRAFT_1077282 [Trametes cingulata]|nr:hypothetical protein OH77DRAFT_1077282 [Trametes cingulata]
MAFFTQMMLVDLEARNLRPLPSIFQSPVAAAAHYDTTDKAPARVLKPPKYSVIKGYRRSPLIHMIKRPEVSSCSIKRRETLTAWHGSTAGARSYTHGALANSTASEVMAKSGRSPLGQENTIRPSSFIAASSRDAQTLVKTPPAHTVSLPQKKPVDDARPRRIKLALERKAFSNLKSSSKVAGKLGGLSRDPFLHEKLLNRHKAYWTPSTNSQSVMTKRFGPQYAGRGTPSMRVLPRPAVVPRPRIPGPYTVPSATPLVPPPTANGPADVLRLHRLALKELPKNFKGRTNQAFTPELILRWKFEGMSIDMDVDLPHPASAEDTDPDIIMEIVEPEDEIATFHADVRADEDDAEKEGDRENEEQDKGDEQEEKAEHEKDSEQDEQDGEQDEKDGEQDKKDGQAKQADALNTDSAGLGEHPAADHVADETVEQQAKSPSEALVEHVAPHVHEIPAAGGMVLRPVDLPDCPEFSDDQLAHNADAAQAHEDAASRVKDETSSEDFRGRETILVLPPVDTEYRPFYNPLPWQESLLLGPVEVKRDEPLRTAPSTPWFESLLFSVDAEQ